MNKLLHAQIGNVVQNGIFNALNGNLNLKKFWMQNILLSIYLKN